MQLVIALVVTPDGFPLAYEVMNGNTADSSTLRDFLAKIEKTYGKARRVWVMDRGIPSEAILKEMREPERQTFYLVGTPKGRINQHEKKWLDLPWQKVRDSVEVKLYQHEGELYVLAKSSGRQAKENRHAAQAAGASAAQTARHAKESAQTRSTAAAHRRGEEGSGPRFRLREDSASGEGSKRSRARPSRFTPTRRSSRLPSSATGIICCAAISPAKTRRCCGHATCS